MISSHRISRVPWGLIGMLLIIFVMERWIARHNLDLISPTAADWRQSAVAATRRAPRAEILCFGDSMVKFGVLPRVLETRLGRTSYNLALYSGAPQMSYFLLQRALKGGANPAAIVVDFQPESLLADHLHLHAREWPEALNTREILEFASDAHEPDFVLSATLARIFPSIRHRVEIRDEIVAGLAGSTRSGRNSILAYQRNWRANQGSQVLPVNPENIGDVPSHNALFFDNWTPHWLNALYARKFLKLAESKAIPVFWVIPPNVPLVQQKRAAIGLTARYDHFVRSALAKHKNLTVLDARELGLSHQFFVDAVHLDRRGATELSNVLSTEIDRVLTGSSEPRLVAFQPSQRQMAQIPLEDVFGSIEVLQKAKVLR